MIRFIRYLLFPFSLLYALIVLVRNWAYDQGLLKSQSFPFPVVVIGNLSVGGTGKSPMTEYILRLMQGQQRIAMLSRGYGRKTKGFREVKLNDKPTYVGDEPLQIKRKFKETLVVVCEDRVRGISHILDQTEAVLLDDAYQHRKLRPSFSILLFDYASLQQTILPLPTGNFRESLQGCKRADLIVISKCPTEIPEQVKFSIESRIRRFSRVPLFYTQIAYQQLQTATGTVLENHQLSDTTALVLTGIAKPQPLLDYLNPFLQEIIHLEYPDHHQFSTADLQKISQHFKKIPASDKIIITTEKDLQRLPDGFLREYPVYFLPIEQRFLFDQANSFDTIVKRAFVR